jgi:2,3-bisphosphoglycerate-independent phosphoglycerate mutase
VIIALTGDHTTPIKVGDHTFEPVPFTVSSHFAICNEMGLLNKEHHGNSKSAELLQIRDSVELYNEIAASEGILGRFSGAEVQGILRRFRELIRETI